MYLETVRHWKKVKRQHKISTFSLLAFYQFTPGLFEYSSNFNWTRLYANGSIIQLPLKVSQNHLKINAKCQMIKWKKKANVDKSLDFQKRCTRNSNLQVKKSLNIEQILTLCPNGQNTYRFAPISWHDLSLLFCSLLLIGRVLCTTCSFLFLLSIHLVTKEMEKPNDSRHNFWLFF